jgi:hypothetical protein
MFMRIQRKGRGRSVGSRSSSVSEIPVLEATKTGEVSLQQTRWDSSIRLRLAPEPDLTGRVTPAGFKGLDKFRFGPQN